LNNFPFTIPPIPLEVDLEQTQTKIYSVEFPQIKDLKNWAYIRLFGVMNFEMIKNLFWIVKTAKPRILRKFTDELYF